MTEAEDILSVAAGWVREGERVALATVTETWGSSPRPPGSQMAVTATGRMAGVRQRRLYRGRSGGGSAGHHRGRSAATAGFRHHGRARLGGRAGLRRQAEGVRGSAGMKQSVLDAVQEARGAGRPVVLATRLPDGEQVLLPDPCLPRSFRRRHPGARLREERRTGGGGRHLVPPRLQPAGADRHRRRRAHRAGAGAAGGATRLRHHRGRPAPRLRQPGALPPT